MTTRAIRPMARMLPRNMAVNRNSAACSGYPSFLCQADLCEISMVSPNSQVAPSHQLSLKLAAVASDGYKGCVLSPVVGWEAGGGLGVGVGVGGLGFVGWVGLFGPTGRVAGGGGGGGLSCSASFVRASLPLSPME